MIPYLCISPACLPNCSGCNRAISNDEARKHAVRYLLLERMDPRYGMPAEWLQFDTLREAVDAELAKLTPPDERDETRKVKPAVQLDARLALTRNVSLTAHVVADEKLCKKQPEGLHVTSCAVWLGLRGEW